MKNSHNHLISLVASLSLPLQLHIGAVPNTHLIFAVISVPQSFSPINLLVLNESLGCSVISRYMASDKVSCKNYCRQPGSFGSMIRLIVHVVDAHSHCRNVEVRAARLYL